MVEDGRVAALLGGGIGWPGFAAVAKLPFGARFIAPSADDTLVALPRVDLLHPGVVHYFRDAGLMP